MLEIKNLTKKYGTKIAVNNISLSVKTGEIFGFVGPNGAGKTTTIRAIVGALEYDSGDILINGKNIKDDSIEVKKEIAYLQDNPEIYEFLTGYGYLNFICDIFKLNKGNRKQEIEKYAKLFALEDDLNKLISTYSHGMKQKLCLISVFVHKPKLMILDEPFVGLDPKSSHILKNLMKEFCASGGSIFLSSHILEIVEKICHSIAIISEGKIIANGKVKEVIANKSLEEIFLKMAYNE